MVYNLKTKKTKSKNKKRTQTKKKIKKKDVSEEIPAGIEECKTRSIIVVV